MGLKILQNVYFFTFWGSAILKVTEVILALTSLVIFLFDLLINVVIISAYHVFYRLNQTWFL